MKKYVLCIMAACACLTAAGCGNMRVDAPAATPVPYVDTDINDGIVRDKDGIITERDTDTRNNEYVSRPENNTKNNSTNR